MSKMIQLHAELTEQAAELGFESIEEAENNGYEVISDGEWAKLVKSEDEQEEAHNEWLKKKSQVLTRLGQLQIYLNNRTEHGHFWGKDDWEVVADAIKFIEEGEV